MWGESGRGENSRLTDALTAPSRRSVAGRAGRVRLRMPMHLAQALKSFDASDGYASWLARFTGGSPLSSIMSGGMGDTVEIRDIYLQETWASACIDQRTLAVALAKPRIWDRHPDDDAAQEVTSGDAFDLLESPNALTDGLGLRTADALNCDLGNESVHFLIGSSGEPVRTMGDAPNASILEFPSEIAAIRGDRLELELHDVTGLPWMWKWRRGGETRRWPYASSVHYGEIPDPYRPYRFIGPLATLIGPANLRYLATRYQSFIMRNDGSGGGWIEMEGPMPSRDEVDRVESDFAERWDNPELAGSTHALWGGKYRDTGTNPKNLAWPELHQLTREDICAKLGVAKSQLGDGASNYATFIGDWKRFIETTVATRFIRYQSRWNRSFFRRFRDRRVSEMRLRFDLERLRGLFDDAEQQAKTAETFTGIGLPLNEALRQSGVKADPIEGGDVPMVSGDRTPLAAAILEGQARAARAAIEAQLDPAQAWALAGLVGAQIVEPPAPEPEADPDPEPEPDAAEGESDEDQARAARAVAKANPRAASQRAAGEAGRAQTLRQVERLTAKPRRTLMAAIQRVFRQMGTAQRKALEQFAAEGRIDRAAAFAMKGAVVKYAEGEAQAPLPPVYLGSAPALFDPDALEAFAASLYADLEAGAVEVLEVDCIGNVLGSRDVETWEMRQAWASVYAEGLTVRRACDLAALQRATLTEQEIDVLVVLTDAKWRDALYERLYPVTLDVYTAAAEDLAREFGVSVGFDVENPAVLGALQRHAIKVVEGVQSTVARRMRSDIIRVLADKQPGVSLQQTIAESLGELQATTTQAFKDHHARALAIARTETGRAVNAARSDESVKLLEEGIIEEKEWLTSGQPEEPDGPTRSAHFAMEGVRTTPGIPYQVDGVPMLYPLDPSAPARLVVNCKCADNYLLPDDD